VPVGRLTKCLLCGHVCPAAAISSKSKMISLHSVTIHRTITISIKTSIIRNSFCRNKAEKLFGRQYLYVPTYRSGHWRSSIFPVRSVRRLTFYKKNKLVSLHSNALLRTITISIKISIIRNSYCRNNAEKLFGRQYLYVPSCRSGDWQSVCFAVMSARREPFYQKVKWYSCIRLQFVEPLRFL
jgi:hypothetical protein